MKRRGFFGRLAACAAALFGVAAAKADDIDLSKVDCRLTGDNPPKWQAVPPQGLCYNGVCLLRGHTQLVMADCSIDEHGNETYTLVVRGIPAIKG